MLQSDTNAQEVGASLSSGSSESPPAHFCPAAEVRQVGPGCCRVD